MMALTILITGGIGSGKSVVSGILRALGIPVYDTDSRTKALYEGELGMRLEEELGQKLHTADGHFDRKALAALIFSDRQVLDKVEEIVHDGLDKLEAQTTLMLEAAANRILK